MRAKLEKGPVKGEQPVAMCLNEWMKYFYSQQWYRMFVLDKTSVCSFGQRDLSSPTENGDATEYVFEVDVTNDGCGVASSMSDNSISISDRRQLTLLAKTKAHKNTITRIEASRVHSSILFSCAEDKTACGWDVRCFERPIFSIAHQDEVTALSVGVTGTLLSTGCGSSINFYDVRFCNGTAGSNQKPNKLGVYTEVHSDMVTQLRFHPTKSHILVSGSEDGLICVCDTSIASEEDAMQSVLNTECPVGRIGFFGAENEGIYSLSTVETLSFWHAPTAQRVAHFPNIREDLRADYLVDCFCVPNRNEVYLLAGDYSGQGVVAQIQPSHFDVLGYLRGGHVANIRCCSAGFDYATASSSGGSGGLSGLSLITGAEDARLCSWMTAAEPAVAAFPNAPSATPGNTALQGTAVSPSAHQRSGGNIKVKKDAGKMRFKPY